MDSKGARALARRIEQHQGVVPEPVPVARVDAADAAPIFHWFGIEPTELVDDGAPAPVARGLAEPA